MRIGRFYATRLPKHAPVASGRNGKPSPPCVITARIKLARRQAGFTQAEMAAKLGVALRTYQNFESQSSKRIVIPWRSLGRIAELTDCSYVWLVTGEELADV